MLDPPNIHHFKHKKYIIFPYIFPVSFHTPHLSNIFFQHIPIPKKPIIFPSSRASVRTMHGTTCCLQTPEGLQAQVPSVQAVTGRTQLPTNPVPAVVIGMLWVFY